MWQRANNNRDDKFLKKKKNNRDDNDRNNGQVTVINKNNFIMCCAAWLKSTCPNFHYYLWQQKLNSLLPGFYSKRGIGLLFIKFICTSICLI